MVRNQLARLLVDQGRESEAEPLFREAHAREPDDPVARVELARLLARTGREDEAEDLLRRTIEDLPDTPVAPYILALLLIAWGRPEEAAAVHARYMQAFGQDKWSTTLQRLLDTGAAGVEEARQRLADRDPHPESGTHPIELDVEVAKRDAALKGEERRAAAAGRADLLFQTRDTAAAERTLTALLADDPGDLYPQVVWALHTPERRTALAERYREALGALAPHLAAAGPETPVSHWECLYKAFPERRGLIDFTRLICAGYEETVAARLEDWIAADEDDQDAFLRTRLREAVARDGHIDPAAPGLDDLLNGAIRGEVDLGDGVLGEVA